MEFMRRLNQPPRRPGEPLAAGGGGDNSGGMESRIAKLESDVGHIRDTLVGMRSDLREMRTGLTAEIRTVSQGVHSLDVRVGIVETSLREKPSKTYVFAAAAGVMAFVAACVTFQEQLIRLAHFLTGH